MERLQGPINPSFYGEHLDVESFDRFFNTNCFRPYEEEEEEEEESLYFETNLSLQDYKMPFLQMLHSAESQPSRDPLFRLEHAKKPCEMDSQIMTLDLESCITHETKESQQHHSTCCLEALSPTCNQEEPNSFGNSGGSTSPRIGTKTSSKKTQLSKSLSLNRERKKRKRSKRPTKNEDEVESQRMTHIAVERNRRRQMNDHLNALRSLMPPSYVQRGDQASIIGGAINFVKELEQLLESLQAQKRTREETEESNGVLTKEINNCSEECNRSGGGFPVESSMSAEAAAEIEVTVIQTHVNLRVQCVKRPGQLLKAIVALEDLRLTVLHLNITSSQSLIHYSFNLKIEEGCKIGSADEIAGAVHQIFNFINGF